MLFASKYILHERFHFRWDPFSLRRGTDPIIANVHVAYNFRASKLSVTYFVSKFPGKLTLSVSGLSLSGVFIGWVTGRSFTNTIRW